MDRTCRGSAVFWQQNEKRGKEALGLFVASVKRRSHLANVCYLFAEKTVRFDL